MQVFLCTLLLLVSFQVMGSACSDNWKVTGYYSPIEMEFAQGVDRRIKIKDVGYLYFNKAFIKEVKMEGWGRTRFGWYLGYFSNQFHKSKVPLNAKGHHLQLGVVAIDTQYLKMGNKVSIPQVNDVIGVNWFVASDTGSAIKKKHIDVYTGEGKLAKVVTWRVTGKKQVCITSV